MDYMMLYPRRQNCSSLIMMTKDLLNVQTNGTAEVIVMSVDFRDAQNSSIGNYKHAKVIKERYVSELP
jgi:hypothetical protein